MSHQQFYSIAYMSQVIVYQHERLSHTHNTIVNVQYAENTDVRATHVYNIA